MSPLTALWVASIIGASLFFSSGVLSADSVLRLLGGKLKLRLFPLAGGASLAPLPLAAANTPEGPIRSAAGEDASSADTCDLADLRHQLELERRERAHAR